MIGAAFAAMVSAIALGSASAQTRNEAASNAPAYQTGTVGPHADDSIFARDSYKLTPAVCPFKGAVKYKPGEVSCGFLTVPENREKPDSRMIDLLYVKIAAKKPKDWDEKKDGAWSKRDDPIIYLTGGPGAQVAGYVKRLKKHSVLDRRDLYILEQRGIGESGDFCPFYYLLDPAASNTPDFDAAQRARIDAMEKCFASAKARGVDLSGYNTIENARDVKALRRALGFKNWNVWGISYGSYLGQAYLKEDPEGVRAAVIDAIAPLEPRARFQKIGGSFQRELDKLNETCKADAACAKNFPDFIGQLKKAIVKVRDKGPIKVKAIDTEAFPSGEAYFFQDLVGGAAFMQFYEQKNFGGMPAFISALSEMIEKNDHEVFRLLTAGDMGGPEGVAISQGMYDAIGCNDNWVSNLREALEEDRAAHPVLSSLQGDPKYADDIKALCKKYGMPGRPPEQYAPTQTSIRTIIADGAMDPITPPPFAKMILPGFSNGTYVEFPYAGHGPTRSVKCAGDFLNKFFDNPDGELDRSCADDMKAPHFTGKVYRARGLVRLAIAAAEDPKNVALPAMWIGFSALILLFGALIYSIAPVARLINGSQTPTTGGARPLAWAVSLLGVASLGGLAYSAFATVKAAQLLLLVGLVPIAQTFVLTGYLAGALGLAVLFMTVRARAREKLPVGVLSGLWLTGLAAVALAAFLGVWGFSPF